MCSVYYLKCFLIASVVQIGFSYEILCIFPRPAYSHQAVFRAVTEKLLENGHQITLLSTHPSEIEKSHENLTLIDVSFSVAIFQKKFDEFYELKSMTAKFQKLIESESLLVDKQLSSNGMQKLLKDRSKKFDLLLLETAGFSPFHALADRFKVPVVGISSADAFSVGHEIMGNVMNPIAHPDRVLPFTIAKTFKERLASCFYMLMMKFVIIPQSASHYDAIMKKHFPEVTKSYLELVSNVDFQFVNAHPALGFVRPILPNTIQLGFLHIKQPKSLPVDLLKILDNSNNGAIYMSFGTMITSKLADKNYANFMKAFADLPYEVFWKFDGESTFDSVPSNVHLMKWFPQSDLLAHPKIKLFITHGVSFIVKTVKMISRLVKCFSSIQGQHSIEESIMRHVPMVVCPFHGDQEANAERCSERGISKTLNIHEKLDSVQIKNVINVIIESER